MARTSKRWTATATLLVALSGCTSFIGRATAPDERPEFGLDELGIPDFGPAPSGPSVIVHVESSHPASLVELERSGGVIGRCTAPCDRSLSLDGTYRIDGRDIRSSWPFHLTGHSGERVTVTVAASERSTYATAKTVGTVGGVAASIGFAAALGGALAATSSTDANGGSGAACGACSAAVAGGAALMLAGIGVAVTGLAVGIANMSSAASQTSSDPLPPPSSPQAIWRSPDPVAAALPRATTAPLLSVSF